MPGAATRTEFTAQEWRVFGTGARLVVPTGADIAAARRVVDAELAAIDLAASRFREDSEISRLNRAQGRPQQVSELFAELIGVGLDAARSTDGAVDPALGSVLETIGYDRTFRAVPEQGPPIQWSVQWQAAWQMVDVDPGSRTVRLPAGVLLDLGATAKAYASDRAAAAASRATGSPVLLSLGGDIALAGPAPEGGWAIAVAEDSADVPAGTHPVVVVTEGGIATSSTTVRAWRRGDAVVHHLIDPWTGRSAAGPWRTVTVAASSCLAANVAATASVVLGSAAPAWLRARGLPARLVDGAGAVRVLNGWPEEGG